METALGICLVILVYGFTFGNGINKKELKFIAKEADRKLSLEFEKRDNKIKELEERIKSLENNS